MRILSLAFGWFWNLICRPAQSHRCSHRRGLLKHFLHWGGKRQCRGQGMCLAWDWPSFCPWHHVVFWALSCVTPESPEHYCGLRQSMASQDLVLVPFMESLATELFFFFFFWGGGSGHSPQPRSSGSPATTHTLPRQVKGCPLLLAYICGSSPPLHPSTWNCWNTPIQERCSSLYSILGLL